MNKLLTILIAAGLILGQGMLGGNAAFGQKGKKKSKRDKDSEKSAPAGDSGNSRVDYLFIEANTQYQEGKAEDALGIFKEVLKLDADHHASMYAIAKISREQKDFETAEKYAKMALEQDASNYWYHFEMVQAYEGRRQFGKALERQEELVRRFPEDKNGLFDLAQMYIGRKDYDQAVGTYNQLETLIGMNEDVVFRKHQLYLYLDQPNQALAEVDKLIAFNPNDPRYRQAKYDIYLLMEEEDKALQVLKDLLEVNPNDGFALLALADYYNVQGNTTKSDEYLFRAFGNPEVELESKVKILGSLYQFSDEEPGGQERLQKLGDLLFKNYPESPMVMAIRGDIFRTEGKLDSARQYYLNSVQADATNEQVWQELLLIDAEASNYPNMAQDAEAALELFPNQAAFLYFFGLGSSMTDDPDGAIYAFEKIKKIGGTTEELRLQAFLSLGEIYHKEEQFAKSDENFEAALEMAPRNPSALNNFAYFLSLRNEQLDRAEEMVLKALSLDPAQSAYQDTYGWILYLQGDYPKAEEWIGKAIKNGGAGSSEVLEHYGDVWIKLGDSEKAQKYWQAAIDLGGEFSIDDKIKKAGIK